MGSETIDSASDPDQEYIYDSASDPDQEYIYLTVCVETDGQKDMARSNRLVMLIKNIYTLWDLVMLIKNIYTLWGWKRLLHCVANFCLKS